MDKQTKLVEKYFVLNGLVKPVNDFCFDFPTSSKIIYEVIRVKNSAPIFFEQHLERLFRSINILGLMPPDKNLIGKIIVDLLQINPVAENNIRLSLVYGSSIAPDFLAYFIPSSYPTEIERKNGVMVKTLIANRENPNVKLENINIRKQANSIIKDSGCYEVLLINSKGFITEGSRSNVFFIKNDTLYTPPLDMVLGGITRQVVINTSGKIGIPVKEVEIPLDSLSAYDGAILTGTSPKILPIAFINSFKLNVNSSFIIQLVNRYDLEVKKSIENWLKKFNKNNI